MVLADHHKQLLCPQNNFQHTYVIIINHFNLFIPYVMSIK